MVIWYRIMWVSACLVSAVIGGISHIFCSLVLCPGKFYIYIYELFLLLPLGLFNNLLDLTTRTFLISELSFKSSAHLPVIFFKVTQPLDSALSLSFDVIFCLEIHWPWVANLHLLHTSILPCFMDLRACSSLMLHLAATQEDPWEISITCCLWCTLSTSLPHALRSTI